MNGLQLAEEYYKEFGESMLREQFPGLLDKIAVGLVGSGSECFGYDDEVSTDHDFEPGFCIFIPGEEELDSRSEFQLERAYAKLPKEFKGFERAMVSPVGGNRHGVIRMNDFFKNKLGTESGELSLMDWLRIPEYSILEVTNGRLFYDGSGKMTAVREVLQTMPEDIRRKKLAGHLLTMAQAGQYNYFRSIKRGDCGAAQLAVFEFVQSGIQVVYSLNGALKPYYKWAFRGMKDLQILPELAVVFEDLVSTGNEDDMARKKGNAIEETAAVIIGELRKQNLTELSCNDLEKHAYSVNDSVKDTNIRYLNIFAAV